MTDHDILNNSQSMVPEENHASDESKIDADFEKKLGEIPDIYAHVLKRHMLLYPEDGTHKQWVNPQLIILFATGDITQVTEAILKDLKHPIGKDLIASVLVEESIREDIINRLRARLQPMDERLHKHPNYQRSLSLIDRMNCSTIHLEEFEEADTKKRYGHMKPGSPIVVLDFPQYYFGDKPSAVITLSTFRNFNEAVKLSKREGLDFGSVSVWSAKLAQCFELVTRMPLPTHWTFNCRNVPLDFLRQVVQPTAAAVIKGNFHHEVHTINGKLKTISFRIN